MHKSYRMISALLAASILMAGTTLSVSAKGLFDSSVDTESVTLAAERMISSSLEEQIEASQTVITEESAESMQEEELEEEIEEAFGCSIDEIAVANVDDCVNVRESASKSSDVVGKLYADSVAIITKTKDGWYKIESGDVTGYVKKKYLDVGDAEKIAAAEKTIAEVTADSLRVREEASTDSEILTSAAEGAELEVLAVEDDWIEVSTSAGDGYVSADYVEVSTGYTYALTIEEIEEAAAAEAAAAGASVVSYASQFVGNPYVYGGTSLTNGADCSGFVMSVYAHFGISLPHSSYALRSVGVAVDRSDIQPGDIVCYNGHVGIYAGNNTLIHASNARDGIKYTYGIDYRTIVAIRRVL